MGIDKVKVIMQGYPEIVVLCGSTRFVKTFDEMMLKFTLAGKVVLTVGTHFQSDHGSRWVDQKEMLDELHKRKIDLADVVFVINKDGYIGESTQSEIEYAERHGKKILLYECEGPHEYDFSKYPKVVSCADCEYVESDLGEIDAICQYLTDASM